MNESFSTTISTLTEDEVPEFVHVSPCQTVTHRVHRSEVSNVREDEFDGWVCEFNGDTVTIEL